jgi:CAAX protease family protein
MGAVLATFLGVMAALIFCGALAIAVAHQVPGLRHLRPAVLADDPRVLLPAQLTAYFLVLAGLWRWFGHHLRVGFLRALSWRWPSRALHFLAGGALLGLSVQWVSHWLPQPPELPIDKMLRTPTDAWLMTAFGILIAPFAEEVFFRGLLFPALARHTGAILSLIVTALLFGAIHSQQLGDAWLQVACIALVGAVLTAVRWRYHSLASSMLVHMGYNGVLFAVILVQTHGFTHLAGV